MKKNSHIQLSIKITKDTKNLLDRISLKEMRSIASIFRYIAEDFEDKYIKAEQNKPNVTIEELLKGQI